MKIDILDMTDEELAALNLQQILILRAAQMQKNEMLETLAADQKSARLLLLANGMARSSVYDEMCAELRAEYEKKLAALVEKLEFNLANASYVPPTEDKPSLPEAPYLVDYSLSLLQRVEIVQIYYLSIEDPVYRMRLYANDEVAKAYLGDYYAALYAILEQYST